MDPSGRWRSEVTGAVASGVRTFIAAGGDGTVHALVEVLASEATGVPLDAFTLGGVGLGSSNDFEKPVRLAGLPCRSESRGVSCRLNSGAAAPRDIVRVSWKDGTGRSRQSVLVVSGSIGLVAEGNALFSRSRLRRFFTGPAIAAAALGAIARHHPFPVRLSQAGRVEEISLSFLSILKTPWLSGSLRFDIPVASDDGLLVAAFCAGMSRTQLLGTLIGLSHGHFCGREGTGFVHSDWIEVAADEPFFLELDGEVTEAREARFDVLPGRIRVCA
jgi:diacylglycerol kinase (ATP)